MKKFYNRIIDKKNENICYSHCMNMQQFRVITNGYYMYITRDNIPEEERNRLTTHDNKIMSLFCKYPRFHTVIPTLLNHCSGLSANQIRKDIKSNISKVNKYISSDNCPSYLHKKDIYKFHVTINGVEFDVKKLLVFLDACKDMHTDNIYITNTSVIAFTDNSLVILVAKTHYFDESDVAIAFGSELDLHYNCSMESSSMDQNLLNDIRADCVSHTDIINNITIAS